MPRRGRPRLTARGSAGVGNGLRPHAARRNHHSSVTPVRVAPRDHGRSSANPRWRQGPRRARRPVVLAVATPSPWGLGPGTASRVAGTPKQHPSAPFTSSLFSPSDLSTSSRPARIQRLDRTASPSLSPFLHHGSCGQHMASNRTMESPVVSGFWIRSPLSPFGLLLGLCRGLPAYPHRAIRAQAHGQRDQTCICRLTVPSALPTSSSLSPSQRPLPHCREASYISRARPLAHVVSKHERDHGEAFR